METNEPIIHKHTQPPIIFIDSMNLFLRSYFANQAVNASGEMVGGVIGFLKQIEKINSLFKPTKIFICWEQGGSSKKRKKIFPEYKANRAKQKDFDNLYVQHEETIIHENKTFQLDLLTKLLGLLPVCQLYVTDTEADDLIAWLVRGRFNSYDGLKVVVSSDKDFYQLLQDPTVRIYDLNRKIIVDQDFILKEFNIAPRNITLARCLEGDQSDNIPGLHGIGMKTAAKRFKQFSDTENDFSIKELIEAANGAINGLSEGVSGSSKKKKEPPKCYQDIVDGETIIRRNWSLMYLDISDITYEQTQKLNYRIDDFQPKIQKMEFLKLLLRNDIPVSGDLDSVPLSLKNLVFNSSGKSP